MKLKFSRNSIRIQKTCHRMKLKLNFSRNDFEMMWKQVELNSLETELFDAFKLNSIRIQKTCHRTKLKY